MPDRRIALPGGVPGHVVTRFPPEPSWQLDVGHAKAAVVNEYLANSYQGQWIMRFDDTNPRTCQPSYVASYYEDLQQLGLHPSRVTCASDYFQGMIDTATQLVAAGVLYADATPSELMRQQRGEGVASAARDTPPPESLRLWQEMQAGSGEGQRYCLRFRLEDPAAVNKCLRDPVAFRVVLEPHCSTGTRFKVYPTYDFAAPYLDLAEGVSHALRTLEFRDRDELYAWVQRAILVVRPCWSPTAIWEFPRIRFQHTPVTKAQQRALLAAGCVEGVDDPRLPTLRGLMRQGLSPAALKDFLLEQITPARRETCHSWDKVWALNRQLLEPSAPRHMAVVGPGAVLLRLSGLGVPVGPVAHLQQLKAGQVARVVRAPTLWLEQQDVEGLQVGDQIMLLAWGNATITHIAREAIPGSKRGSSSGSGDTCSSCVPGRAVDPAHSAAAAFDSDSSRCGPAANPPAPRQQQQQQEEHAALHPGTSRQGLSSSQHQGKSPDWVTEQADTAPVQDQQPRVQHTAAVLQDIARLALAALHEAASSPPPAPAEAAANTHNSCTPEGVVLPLGKVMRGSETARAAAPAAAGGGPCRVLHMSAVLDLAGSPKAAKRKMHWVPALPQQQLVGLQLISYSLPCKLERLTADDDAVACFDWDSKRITRAIGDPSLLLLATKGTVVQLQRHGLYIIDQLDCSSYCQAFDRGSTAAAVGSAAHNAAATASNMAGAESPPVAVPPASELQWPEDGTPWPPTGWYNSSSSSSSSSTPCAAGGTTGASTAIAYAALTSGAQHGVHMTLIQIPDGHTTWVPKKQQQVQAGGGQPAGGGARQEGQ